MTLTCGWTRWRAGAVLEGRRAWPDVRRECGGAERKGRDATGVGCGGEMESAKRRGRGSEKVEMREAWEIRERSKRCFGREMQCWERRATGLREGGCAVTQRAAARRLVYNDLKITHSFPSPSHGRSKVSAYP